MKMKEELSPETTADAKEASCDIETIVMQLEDDMVKVLNSVSNRWGGTRYISNKVGWSIHIVRYRLHKLADLGLIEKKRWGSLMWKKSENCKMVFVGYGEDRVDHYTYEAYWCAKCGKTEVKNKRYKKTYDAEGGASD